MPSGTPDQQTQAAQLKEALNDKFSEDELKTLAFDMGFDYDDLPGDSRPVRILAFVRLAQRRNVVGHLIAVVNALRPPNA